MAESLQDLGPDQRRIAAQAADAFRSDDAVRLGELFDLHPFLKSLVNEPLLAFDAPPIVHVRSRAMLDVLLEAGADINARSRWWAGGFGLLDWASPAVAAYAIARGATVTVHAAARLGLADRLQAIVTADPASAHARGGDGQTPLHVAQTVEVAQILLAAGADIDARDVDHESTPAQYLVGERPDVVRYLVARGCRTDLLLAAALGDVDDARRHLDADPTLIRMRANGQWFPMKNPRAGGTIYQWTLGFHASAHQVAHDRGHTDLLELLNDRSPPSLRLLEACWIGDGAAVERLLSQGSAVVDWTADEQVLIAHAARNNRTEAVRLMLECGLPVDTRGQHRATPLHWAAFHGNAEMTRAILRHGPPLELADNDFSGTPLGWAFYGSEHGWHAKTGDYAAAVALLLRAGARRPSKAGGSAAVLAVLSLETGHESR